MRLSILLCLVVCLLACPSLFAQKQSTQPVNHATKANIASTVEQASPKMVQITADFVVVSKEKLKEKELGFAQSITNINANDTIKKLINAGDMSIIDHIELVTLEGQQAMVQSGRTIPIITGSMMSSRSPNRINTVKNQSVGKILQVTPKVNGNSVHLQVTFEKSDFQETANADEVEEPAMKQEQTSYTVNTTIKLENGKSIILASSTNTSNNRAKASVLILSATILD